MGNYNSETARIVSANIRKLREGKNLSRQDLAEHLNIAATTIGGWENDGKFPGYDMLERLAEIFGVQVFSLFMKDLGEGAESVLQPADDVVKFLICLNAILTSEPVTGFEEDSSTFTNALGNQGFDSYGYKIVFDKKVAEMNIGSGTFRDCMAYMINLLKLKKGNAPIRDELYLLGLRDKLKQIEMGADESLMAREKAYKLFSEYLNSLHAGEELPF